MSELLLRGWNVAVPVVDIGDDVFVIDDNDKTTHRLQVKSATPDSTSDGIVKASFKLSRKQLREQQAVELFFMLLVREPDRWSFLVVPRVDLSKARDAFVDQPRASTQRGRPPVGDDAAKTDDLTLSVVITGEGVTGWGADLAQYFGRWPRALAPVIGGPGAVQPDHLGVTEAEALVPSPDPEK